LHCVIGIDCATQPEKVGLSLGYFNGRVLEIENAIIGSRQCNLASTIAEWVEGQDSALLALDAPLGWPAELGRSLSQHQAGESVVSGPNELFRRRTDDRLFERLGKRPLEVGANLIARTAHAALTLLSELRRLTERNIPLAWDPADLTGIAAIEVYPAASCIARGFANNRNCLDRFQTELLLPDVPPLTPVHIHDAVICAIAGADFLAGKCVSPEPEDVELARKEGWIWARRRDA
jgi:predicted nuclease with RNAse H fold